MQVVDEFPRAVREIENVFIELADRCRRAARIWLPADAESEPVAAILEYLPCRKRDGTSQRDALTHPYFAGHGYACVRVDMRGNGESDGVMLDECTLQEQDDALEVIDWIARQPWCTGVVGMIGISWGGFNGLQVAARRPPALKAVITLCSTDDRYADDMHFMGGCLLNDNLSWASTMFAYSSRPPDPALLGERWRELWPHRLEHTVLLVEEWLRHQRRDRQWQHGLLCENFAAIQCPVFAVGGWADGYSNAIPRLLAGLEVPRKGLMGPWAHKYPHFATPGPQIGFLQECLRWWDHWLKVIDTASWTSRCTGCGCRRACRQGRTTTSARAAGWPSRPGHHPTPRLLITPRGEVVGLVGESGCGKTTLISAVARLLADNAEIRSGEILFDGRDVLDLGPGELRQLRGERIAMVFQDPMTALNPVLTIATQATDVQYRARASRAEKRRRDRDAAARRHPGPGASDRPLPARVLGRHAPAHLHRARADRGPRPADRQRADRRARRVRPGRDPEPDEPAATGARADLHRDHPQPAGGAPHERSLGDHVHGGRFVEQGATRTIFPKPAHPYTEALLTATPVPDPDRRRPPPALRGEVRSLLRRPSGCEFHTRCPYAKERCRLERPLQLRPPGQTVRCHFPLA